MLNKGYPVSCKQSCSPLPPYSNTMPRSQESMPSGDYTNVANPHFEHCHTKNRPPQRNSDNMPSGQVASASEPARVAPTNRPDSNPSNTATPDTNDTQVPGAAQRSITPELRRLSQSYPANIREWVDSAGMGARFNQYLAPSSYSGASTRSCLSTKSTITCQDQALNLEPSHIGDAVDNTGAWCDDAIVNPLGPLDLDMDA